MHFDILKKGQRGHCCVSLRNSSSITVSSLGFNGPDGLGSLLLSFILHGGNIIIEVPAIVSSEFVTTMVVLGRSTMHTSNLCYCTALLQCLIVRKSTKSSFVTQLINSARNNAQKSPAGALTSAMASLASKMKVGSFFNN